MARMPEPVDRWGGALRPDDVPTWRQCWKSALLTYRWMIPAVYVVTTLFVHFLPAFLVTDGNMPSEKQAQFIAEMTNWRVVLAYLIFVTLMMGIMVISTVTAMRAAETPKERETRERRLLASLKQKYPQGT